MTVESRVVGQRSALADVQVPPAAGDYSLGEVLDALVRIEVERYESTDPTILEQLRAPG